MNAYAYASATVSRNLKKGTQKNRQNERTKERNQVYALILIVTNILSLSVILTVALSLARSTGLLGITSRLPKNCSSTSTKLSFVMGMFTSLMKVEEVNVRIVEVAK